MFVVQKGGTNMKKLLVALCALALMVLPLFAQGGAETAVDDSKPITIEFWTPSRNAASRTKRSSVIVRPRPRKTGWRNIWNSLKSNKTALTGLS